MGRVEEKESESAISKVRGTGLGSGQNLSGISSAI